MRRAFVLTRSVGNSYDSLWIFGYFDKETSLSNQLLFFFIKIRIRRTLSGVRLFDIKQTPLTEMISPFNKVNFLETNKSKIK